MNKFKIPLQKDILQVREVLVIIDGEKSCNDQGLCSSGYALVSIQHGSVGCLFIVNGDKQLVRELDYILVPCHSEGAFWIIKSLNPHGIITRAQ